MLSIFTSKILATEESPLSLKTLHNCVFYHNLFPRILQMFYVKDR